jgi:hypothetical protein
VAQDDDADPTHPSIEECVAGTQKAIDRHHKERHMPMM